MVVFFVLVSISQIYYLHMLNSCIKRNLSFIHLEQLGEFPMDCPLQDSLLRVHYKGMLQNEEKTIFFDTRVDNHGQPLEFCSGEGLVSCS